MLKNKNILVGVTGSIAAYKSAVLIRLLVKAGANVRVMMTRSATDFISPLTLSTLSKNPVLIDFVRNKEGEWNNHVEAGIWADLTIIAPASANTIAKMANGLCDNFLMAAYLSARNKVYIAPAMDLDMYRHPATSANIEKLRSYGNIIINPGNGELASGLFGEGRMAEPEEIIAFIENEISAALPLKGRTVLVTAGPTYEAIDPVRFIGNHSSGKMGFAIAEEFASLGASVILITGPTALEARSKNIRRIDIMTAEELNAAAVREFRKTDIAVLSAAVADFKPSSVSSKKIKKAGGARTIELTETKDTLQELGRMKKKGQVLVGFALETDHEIENARKKLVSKNLDFIVLNSLKDNGAGFRTDTNKITIIGSNNKSIKFELKPKAEVARDIVNTIIQKKSRK